MQQDLWRLRHQQRWTINELAEQANVPGLSIHEYEQGRPIRSADLPKLAHALGVSPDEIKPISDPKPRKKPARAKAKPRPPAKKKPAPVAKPAAPTQIQHLQALAVKLGQTESELEAEVGQPLEKLTKKEISTWLAQYTDRIKERRSQLGNESGGLKRWRAHLPEGVDSFELAYLKDKQQAGETLAFTLFNEKHFEGKIIGFGPYNITIQTQDNQEITLQKLAIAYYTVAPQEVAG